MKKGHDQESVDGEIDSDQEPPKPASFEGGVPASDVAAMAKAFEVALGEAPTEHEKLHLLKLARAVGGRYRKDDPFWLVLYAQRHFLSLFEKIPNQVVEAATSVLSGVDAEAQKRVRAACDEQVVRVTEGLADVVARAGLAVADAKAGEASRRALWLAAIGVTLVGGFGALCGYELARGRLPPWMASDVAAQGGSAAKIVGAILGAPAGWVALVFSVPLLAPSVTNGWSQWSTLSNPSGERRWGLVRCVAAIAGIFAELLVLAKFVAWMVVP
jgi:hypothetical protein